jgi:hypothetical protein
LATNFESTFRKVKNLSLKKCIFPGQNRGILILFFGGDGRSRFVFE